MLNLNSDVRVVPYRSPISTVKEYTSLPPRASFDTLQFRILIPFSIYNLGKNPEIKCVREWEGNTKSNFKIQYHQYTFRAFVHNHSNEIKTVHFCPFQFQDIGIMQIVLNTIWSGCCNDAVVTRLDSTLDYKIVIDQLLFNLDITKKRAKIAYDNSNKLHNNIEIGKRPERIKIYSKIIDGTVVTRIEVQQTGKKNPLSGCLISQIQNKAAELFAHIESNNPFKSIFLNYIKFVPRRKINEQEELTLDWEYVVLRKYHGFYQARREYKKRHNYERDIKPRLEIEISKYQPKDYFLMQIKDWLKA